MRFSSTLLALPLVGSVFAAPIDNAKRDAVSTLSGLKNTLGGIASLSPSTIEGDIQGVLQQVENALEAAAAQLGINVGVITGAPGYLSGAFNATQFNLYAIAADLEAIVQDVETIISDTTISGTGSVSTGNLQQEIQNALNSIVLGLAVAVNGLSPLVANLLINLGLNIDGMPIIGASGSGSGLGITGL